MCNCGNYCIFRPEHWTLKNKWSCPLLILIGCFKEMQNRQMTDVFVFQKLKNFQLKVPWAEWQEHHKHKSIFELREQSAEKYWNIVSAP